MKSCDIHIQSCACNSLGNNYCKDKKDGDYVDPSTCYGFISCSNGIVHQMPCPANLVWNNAKKLCDWPANANPPCKNQSAPSYSCKQQPKSSKFHHAPVIHSYIFFELNNCKAASKITTV